MAIWRNTQYTEHAPDAPNERWGPGSTSMSRQFDLVDGSFQGRLQAAYDFLGYAQVVQVVGAPVGTFQISRTNPMPYPALPAAIILKAGPVAVPPDLTNRIYCVGISRTEHLGGPQGVNLVAAPGGTAAANYPRARQTVELATLPYLIKEDADVAVLGLAADVYPSDAGNISTQGWISTRYISRHIQPFSRVLKIPYGIAWRQVVGAAAKQTKTGLPTRESGANITYTWHKVPLEGPVSGANFGRINSFMGTLNSITFDVYPAATLLFDTYSTLEYQGSFGERLADITFQFIFLPHPAHGNRTIAGGGKVPVGQLQGWNSVLDFVDGQGIDYYPVTSDQAGLQPVYDSSPFANMFIP